MINSRMCISIIITLVCTFFFENVSGHGMMLDPPNRSSLWRFISSAPINYEDNQNYCGGFWVQWGENDGKCGVCGDNYADPQPRDNENTGKYGNGVVVAQYISGSVINVTIKLTANHKGYFSYSLCVLENFNEPESEECFQPLQLKDGTYKYTVDPEISDYVNYLLLPEDVICERCVLRWHYNTGNSWGKCENGTEAVGCGNQETFRSCADIRVVETEEAFANNVISLYTKEDVNLVSNSIDEAYNWMT